MMLIDDGEPITGAARDPLRPDPYRRDGLPRRIVPFLAAVGFALALLPLQKVQVSFELLITGVVTLVGVAVLIVLHDWFPARLRRISGLILPLVYIIAIGYLADATGGVNSGYGALMFLAPFWAALYDRRSAVLLTIFWLFLTKAGAFHGDLSLLSVRHATLTALVIGFISLAVQRQVSALLVAGHRIAQESGARVRTVQKLETVNAALERSNRDLEQFAYVSSHDLQEPLRMIRSFSQLFMQRHAETLDDDGRELLEYVVDGAERAQDLVQDLLEYSRIGMVEPNVDDVSLEAALDQALIDLAPAIEEHDVQIERTGNLPIVRGDAPKLARLFTNLVSNAIKYHDPRRRPVIAIVARELGDHRWRIDIVDNGIGFDPEHRDRIFRMFQRLHARAEYPGTGIGLAICARIAEQHDATIIADGAPGRGATFTLLIGGT
ncbi:MAG: ATP-binding protein [Gaiellales bacterium]